MENKDTIDLDKIENEELIAVDEVILSVKLQKELEKDPQFKQAILPHRLFLAGKVLKEWDTKIRVSLYFLASTLEEELSIIEAWYEDATHGKCPKVKIAKRCVGKKFVLPKRLRNQYD